MAIARILLAAALLLAARGAGAAIVEELVHVPVMVRHEILGEVRHELPVTVFRDDARPRAPFVVLGHGRATSATANAALGQARYTANSRYLVSLGFAVFVPTRIGYGIAGGQDLEYSGECAAKRYAPGYDAAAQQTRAVVAYARGRPDIDPGRGLVMGQSYGGATAIAVAADPPEGVRAAVNFAGGGGGAAIDPSRPALLAHGDGAALRGLWRHRPDPDPVALRAERPLHGRAPSARVVRGIPARGGQGPLRRAAGAWRGRPFQLHAQSRRLAPCLRGVPARGGPRARTLARDAASHRLAAC